MNQGIIKGWLPIQHDSLSPETQFKRSGNCGQAVCTAGAETGQDEKNIGKRIVRIPCGGM